MKANVAGCLVEKDGKYLLIKEAEKKHYDQYNLPGGAVEEGETIQDAAIREVKEETGYDVELTGALPIQTILRDNQTIYKFLFVARIVGGSMEERDNREVLGVEWLSKEDLKSLEKDSLRSGNSIFKAIKQYTDKNIFPLELYTQGVMIEKEKDKGLFNIF